MSFTPDSEKGEGEADLNQAAAAARPFVAEAADDVKARREDVAEAARETGEHFADLANEMRDYVVASLSRSVSANPMLALAAAAGVGFLFAQWSSRGGRR